ncbi:hypothetical protein WA026_011886 [Henosepilachna vigintioctopunctata]|uniref:Cytochrome b561 domain-containing protein n=1 Tax=Henosepilachna vigintioctopunctata TaxID=420089 RepID=A0AAW1UAB1_9CUCU
MFARYTSSEFVPFLNINMESQADHARLKLYKTLYTITTALGLGLIVLIVIWFDFYGGGYSLTDSSLEFNWHPVLMITSMLFLYSQSILIYRTARNMPKFKVKCLHAGLHIFILVIAALGVTAVFKSNETVPPSPNLYSVHSWLGILTLALFSCQLVVGFATFLFPGASKNLRTLVLPYHVTVGSSGFIMALFTAGMGLMEQAQGITNYTELPPAGILINTIGLVIIVFGVLTIHLVTDSYYKRTEVLEDIALQE